MKPGESKARGIHQVRAHTNEWDVIQRFMKLVRKNLPLCEKAVQMLEAKILH